MRSLQYFLTEALKVLLCLVLTLVQSCTKDNDGPESPVLVNPGENENGGEEEYDPTDFTYLIGFPVYADFYLEDTKMYNYDVGISFGGHSDIWNRGLEEFAVEVEIIGSHSDVSWSKKLIGGGCGSVSIFGDNATLTGWVAQSPRETMWEGEALIKSRSESVTLKVTPCWKFEKSSQLNYGAPATRTINGKKY